MATFTTTGSESGASSTLTGISTMPFKLKKDMVRWGFPPKTFTLANIIMEIKTVVIILVFMTWDFLCFKILWFVFVSASLLSKCVPKLLFNCFSVIYKIGLNLCSMTSVRFQQ